MDTESKVRAKRTGAAAWISQIHPPRKHRHAEVSLALLGLKHGSGGGEAEARLAAVVTGSLVWTAAGSLLGIRAVDQEARKC